MNERARSRVRRQYGEISANEWQRWPVWEYALDEEGLPGQDELTMRPVEDACDLDPRRRSAMVAARFTLHNGVAMLGTVGPLDPVDPLDADYCITVGAAGKRLSVCLRGPQVGKVAVRVIDEWMAHSLRLLGASFAEAFPILVRPLVPIVGWEREWSLPGFVISDRFGQPMFTEP